MQKTAEFPQWQYVDKVVDVPVVLLVVSSSRTKLLTCRCYADKVLIETVQKTVESPQLVLLLDIVVDVPVLVRHGAVEVPQLQFIDRCVSSSWL